MNTLLEIMTTDEFHKLPNNDQGNPSQPRFRSIDVNLVLNGCNTSDLMMYCSTSRPISQLTKKYCQYLGRLYSEHECNTILPF